MSTWLRRVLAHEPGFERELVERYTHRLLALAREQLPDRVRQRLDPEDVVQSVYLSFFDRLRQGRFAFEDSLDLWRLLAAIAYHKSRNAAVHHSRTRRDARRDRPLDDADAPAPAGEGPTPADVTELCDSLDRLIAGLPDHYRAIVLARLRGEPVAAIADQVRRSQRTVLRVLARVQELAAEQLEASA
jgi:RNA polymerase sigma-70 factor (ECF subfamily)